MTASTSINAEFATTLEATIVSNGKSLMANSCDQPVMLVFLRHFGCTFCREVLRDLGKIKHEIKNSGAQLVLVHMSPPDYAEQVLESFKLAGTLHISNPDTSLYNQFGLRRGNLKQLFGWRMWVRGFQVGVLEGLGVGAEKGDGFMMPGYFLLHQGEVKGEYIPTDAADHPEYLKLAAQAKDCFACEI